MEGGVRWMLHGGASVQAGASGTQESGDLRILMGEDLPHDQVVMFRYSITFEQENMWVGDQGVCHTVALPDPTELMSDTFRQSLDQLMVRDQKDLDEVIEIDWIRR